MMYIQKHALSVFEYLEIIFNSLISHCRQKVSTQVLFKQCKMADYSSDNLCSEIDLLIDSLLWIIVLAKGNRSSISSSQVNYWTFFFYFNNLDPRRLTTQIAFVVPVTIFLDYQYRSRYATFLSKCHFKKRSKTFANSEFYSLLCRNLFSERNKMTTSLFNFQIEVF